MLAFSGAGTVVRCGARALVGWDGCEVRLCEPCAPVSPNVPCGFLAPPVSYRVPELGLALSHVRTRGFLLGPINDVQQ